MCLHEYRGSVVETDRSVTAWWDDFKGLSQMIGEHVCGGFMHYQM